MECLFGIQKSMEEGNLSLCTMRIFVTQRGEKIQDSTLARLPKAGKPQAWVAQLDPIALRY